MNIETFKEIILNFQKESLPEFTPRSLEIQEIANMSIAITGVRRAGKTYRTFQYIHTLLKNGVSPENICRIQFNDFRLRGLTSDGLSGIEAAYYSLYPDKQKTDVVYYIFDEIHRISGWEEFILYLLDTPRKKVLITGSTSKLLTGDIASALRGKNFSLVQFPFSFAEFIRYYKVDNDTVSSNGKAYVRSMMNRYLKQGGFPGLLSLPDNMHVPLLQNYTETMLLKDIIEAHSDDHININTFSDFYQALIARTACPMTVNKIAVTLKKKESKFSNETLYRYLDYLKESFMLYTVEFYSNSEKIRLANYRKIYSIDWALADAIAPGSGIDITRRFENLIFIELLRRGYKPYYFKTKEGFEIDFVITMKSSDSGKTMLIQCCYSLADEDVREREIRAITKSAEFLKSEKNLIITMDSDEVITENKTIIHIIPAWKWLLSEKD